MFLYQLTLQPPTTIQQCITGNFLGPGGGTRPGQEIALVRGQSILELLRVDPTTGLIHSLGRVDTFSTIRAIQAFRIPGDDKGAVSPCCLQGANGLGRSRAGY